MASILDLPLEILEVILTYLRLDLSSCIQLSSVCVKFRQAAFRCPVPVRIPLQDTQLHIMANHRIPVSSLYNREPALFIKYQIGHLNLQRLTEAQIVANDYLAKSNMTTLSPHYMDVLEHIVACSYRSLTMFMVNVDLTIDDKSGFFKCGQLLSQLKQLTFLGLHFTAHIELQEKIRASESSQNFISQNFIGVVTSNLKNLKTLYMYSCPVQKLSISSESLQKLCIYKSEFVEINSLNTPKLTTLMFHEGLTGFFKKAKEDREAGVSLDGHLGLFKALYEGCPSIEYFNTVQVGVLRPHNLTKDEWCHYALKLCIKKYQRRFKTNIDLPMLAML